MLIKTDKCTFAFDVAKIEVEAISKPREDRGYERTFRFTTYAGEVLEVLCAAGDKTFIQIQEVAAIPTLRRKPRPLNWLQPKKP